MVAKILAKKLAFENTSRQTISASQMHDVILHKVPRSVFWDQTVVSFINEHCSF